VRKIVGNRYRIGPIEAIDGGDAGRGHQTGVAEIAGFLKCPDKLRVCAPALRLRRSTACLVIIARAQCDS